MTFFMKNSEILVKVYAPLTSCTPVVVSQKRPLASETPKGPPKKLARVEAGKTHC